MEKLVFDAGVYAADDVKQTLREMQHGKCAFCEITVQDRFYGDVEHFRPKGGWQQGRGGTLSEEGYWWLAYEWTNLLLSCQLCNQRYKRNLFPIRGERARKPEDALIDEDPMLVDPVDEDPSGVIRFNQEVAEGLDERGWTTIEVFGLNEGGNPKGLIESRLERLVNFTTVLPAYDLARRQWERLDQVERERIRELQVALLSHTAPAHPFSAMFRDAIKAFDRIAEVPLAAPLP